jgi:hypothetical protein
MAMNGVPGWDMILFAGKYLLFNNLGRTVKCCSRHLVELASIGGCFIAQISVVAANNENYPKIHPPWLY